MPCPPLAVILLIILILVVLVVLVLNVKIVQQSKAYVIERLGAYSAHLDGRDPL